MVKHFGAVTMTSLDADMGSLDISLGTKREIQLVELHSSFPVRLDGMILKVGQKKRKYGGPCQFRPTHPGCSIPTESDLQMRQACFKKIAEDRKYGGPCQFRPTHPGCSIPTE